jgi:hypothetical protein
MDCYNLQRNIYRRPFLQRDITLQDNKEILCRDALAIRSMPVPLQWPRTLQRALFLYEPM